MLVKIEEDESLTISYAIEVYISAFGVIFGPSMVILLLRFREYFQDYPFLLIITISFAAIPFVSLYALNSWPLRVKLDPTEIKYTGLFRTWSLDWSYVEKYHEILEGNNVTVTFIHKYTKESFSIPAIHINHYVPVIDYIRAHAPTSSS